jgi:hypothetical protein
MEALRQHLATLEAVLSQHGEMRDAELVRRALTGSVEELRAFLSSNELWGGAGSIADQAGIDQGSRARNAIEAALVRLGAEQMRQGLVNVRTEMWVDAFSKWQRTQFRFMDLGLFVAGAIGSALLAWASERWRPELSYAFSLPLVTLVATSIVALTSSRAIWLRSLLAYLTVNAGWTAWRMSEAPLVAPFDAMFGLAISAIPALSGPLAAMAIRAARSRTDVLSPLKSGAFASPFIIVSLMLLRTVSDELRWPSTQLEQRLLEQVPLGGSIQQVEALVADYGWELRRVERSHGYHHQGVRPPRTEGQQHIQAYGGSYRNLFTTDVVIYWGFDEAGKLTSVWVWKTTNSL